MPTEDELRDLLGRQQAPNRLNAKRVVRSSRRRRIPQQIAAGGAGVLAVAGITVLGIQVIPFAQLSGGTPTVMDQQAPDSSEFSQGADTDAARRLPAERINLCDEPVTEIVPSIATLQLDVVSPSAIPVGTGPVDAVVRLTNTGTEPVTGTTASAPVLTLSQNGITRWHTNGAMDSSAIVVDLAPGDTLDFATTFLPVRCNPADESMPEFRTDLPALPAGSYDLSALLYFASDEPTPTTELDLVMGPRAPLAIQ